MKGILINPETGDLQVANGTLAVGDNTDQIAEFVLRAARGEFKEYPLIGGEVTKMINGTPDVMWPADVKKMLLACGVPVKKVVIEGNIITLK